MAWHEVEAWEIIMLLEGLTLVGKVVGEGQCEVKVVKNAGR